MDVENVKKRDPLIGSYTVDVNLRGRGSILPPTISEVEEAVEKAIVELAGMRGTLVTVRAAARRTD